MDRPGVVTVLVTMNRDKLNRAGKLDKRRRQWLGNFAADAIEEAEANARSAGLVMGHAQQQRGRDGSRGQATAQVYRGDYRQDG